MNALFIIHYFGCSFPLFGCISWLFIFVCFAVLLCPFAYLNISTRQDKYTDKDRMLDEYVWINRQVAQQFGLPFVDLRSG